MKKYLLTLTSLCVLGLTLAGCQTENREKQPPIEKESQQAEQNTKVSINVTDEEGSTAQAKINESIEPADEVVEDSAPQYKEYSEEEYTSLKTSKPFVLFFHAEWCPICRQMEKTYTEQLDEFPKGTIILKADYDTENELKSEYGVTTQSTVLVFDSKGDRIYAAQDPRSEDFMAAIKTSLELI